MEKTRTEENFFKLAAESLKACLVAIDNRRMEDIQQKCYILQDTLDMLNKNPEDRLCFNIVLGIGLEVKLGILKLQDLAKSFCFDVFIECVIESLPEELKDEFECFCARVQ